MQNFGKLSAILLTLLAGWSLLIWVQWSNEFSLSTGIIGMPAVMLVMAVLAVLAARDEGIE